jgi:CheY-like chemotaxis protein/anti-sigma regulatory factor (Ser/Thr protein kinase)
MELHASAIDPRSIVLACFDLVRPTAEAKRLQLRLLEAAAVPRHVNADPTRLREVLLNLLGNAVKYTTVGAVEVRLLVTAKPQKLRIEVADTGPGIPAKLRRDLFHDFERLGADAAGTVEGAGLGLALSARLVSLMKGSIGYADNPGGGSVFWVELPLPAARLIPEVPTTGSPIPPLTRPLRLLVVDDVAMNRDVASAFLRAAGHDVVCASSGMEAVQAAAAGHYDAILLDVRMPGMDGLEAARRIRALAGVRGKVPIIALTAQVFAENVEECRRAGMDSHLSKPFTYDALLSAVARVVGDGGARCETGQSLGDTKVVAMTPAAKGRLASTSDISAGSHPGSIEAELPICDLVAFGRTAGFLAPVAVAAHMDALSVQASALLRQMREARNDPATAGALAEASHTLGGSAGLFGFQRIAHAARGYERAVVAGWQGAEAIGARLAVAIEVSLPYMRTHAPVFRE